MCDCVQNKLMEEKNTVLMQTNVSLEEELRKANAAKAQLETYKRQVCEHAGRTLHHVTLSVTRLHLHRWWSCRTNCLKSPKKRTRWSLSTNV